MNECFIRHCTLINWPGGSPLDRHECKEQQMFANSTQQQDWLLLLDHYQYHCSCTVWVRGFINVQWFQLSRVCQIIKRWSRFMSSDLPETKETRPRRAWGQSHWWHLMKSTSNNHENHLYFAISLPTKTLATLRSATPLSHNEMELTRSLSC